MSIKRVKVLLVLAAVLSFASGCGATLFPNDPFVARVSDDQMRDLQQNDQIKSLLTLDTDYRATYTVEFANGPTYVYFWRCEAANPTCRMVTVKDRVQGNTRPGFRIEIEPLDSSGDPIKLKNNSFSVLFWVPGDPRNEIRCSTNDPTFFTADGLKTVKSVADQLAKAGWGNVEVGEYTWKCQQ